jgi:SAM-dependent methyltransferase
VVRCPHCEAGLTLPLAEGPELSGFYPGSYAPYDLPRSGPAAVASAAIRAWQAWRQLRTPPLRALGALPPGRLLDVGCGRGDLGVALVRLGWSVAGVEPSAEACTVARSRGVDARVGTLADVELEPEVYDAVTFQHSLEHVAAPVDDLRRVARALRPGGLALITAPNFGCWQARRFRSRWFHLDLPRHRAHLTRAGLERALVRAGLEPLELSTSSSTVGLPGSVQYRVAGRCLFPSGTPLRLALAACALPYPLALAADRLAGEGDLLHAVARRPAVASARSTSASRASAGAG